MNTTILSSTDIEVQHVTAPLDIEVAWETESLLLKIFEYGDYSFRSALRGEYSETLDCNFFLAKNNGELIGVAGCLCGRNNSSISILGPVGVDSKYRANGVGSRLVESVITYLKDQGCMAIYLGTSKKNNAASFYKKLGFRKYKGIVMRHLLCCERDFEDYYKVANVKIRRAVWGDFPAISVLATIATNSYTYDFRRGIFSSKYVKPTRFLSVFPEMKRGFVKHGGFANVLVAGYRQSVVGIAQINQLSSKTQQHVAFLDFYIHDNFTDRAEDLLSVTINESKALSINKINFYCLDCDHLKRKIIESLGGKQISTLAKSVFINGQYEDVFIYQLR